MSDQVNVELMEKLVQDFEEKEKKRKSFSKVSKGLIYGLSALAGVNGINTARKAIKTYDKSKGKEHSEQRVGELKKKLEELSKNADGSDNKELTETLKTLNDKIDNITNVSNTDNKKDNKKLDLSKGLFAGLTKLAINEIKEGGKIVKDKPLDSETISKNSKTHFNKEEFKNKSKDKSEEKFKGKINIDTASKEKIEKTEDNLVDYLNKNGEKDAVNVLSSLINENRNKTEENSTDLSSLIDIESKILSELKKLNQPKRKEYSANKIRDSKTFNGKKGIVAGSILLNGEEEQESTGGHGGGLLSELIGDYLEYKMFDKLTKGKTPKGLPRGPRVPGKFGKLGRLLYGAGKLATPALAGAGSLVSAGASAGVNALGTVAKGGARAVGNFAKFLGPLGLAVTAGMAIYDGFQGWNKAGENLGIDPKKATTTNKLSSSAGSIISGLTFGLLDTKETSKGINNFLGGNEIIEKYEKLGIIDHNSLGSSTIEDWNKVRELKPEEIQEIIDIDDWTEKDLKHLKECQVDAVNGIKKEEKKTDKGVLDYLSTGVLGYTPVGMMARGLKSTIDFITDDVGEKYEEKGIIDYNLVGDSEIKDWKEVYNLKPEEINELIEFNDFDEETSWRLRKALEDVKNGINVPPEEKEKSEESKGIDRNAVLDTAKNIARFTPFGAIFNIADSFSNKERDELIKNLEKEGILKSHTFGSIEILDWKKIEELSPEDIQNIINLDDFSEEDRDHLIKIRDDAINRIKQNEKENQKSDIKRVFSLISSPSDDIDVLMKNIDNLDDDNLEVLRSLIYKALDEERDNVFKQLDTSVNESNIDPKKLDKVIEFADKLDRIEEEQRKEYLKASGDTANETLFGSGVTSNLNGIPLGSSAANYSNVTVEEAGDTLSDNYTGNIVDETSGAMSNVGPVLDLSNIGSVQISDSSGDLGSYVKEFESGNRGPSAIGYDTNGGTSYGTYQLAAKTGTFKNFLAWSAKNGGEFGQRLASELAKVQPWDCGSRDGKAPTVWKQFAAVNSGRDLNSLEHAFIKETHYDLAYKGINNKELIDKDRGLREALWSTAIQHGPGGAVKIFNSTYKEGMTPIDWLTAIYQARGSRGRFKSSSDAVYSGVVSRFKRELAIVKGLSQSTESNAKPGEQGNQKLEQSPEEVPSSLSPTNTRNSGSSTGSGSTGSTESPEGSPGPEDSTGSESPAQPSQSVSENIAKLKELGVNASQVTTGGGGWSSVSKLNPETLQKLTQAEQEFKQSSGHIVNISSAFRTPEDVKRLSSQANAAKGFSPHQSGFAIDLVSDDGSKTMGAGYSSGVVANFAKVAAKYGLVRPLAPKKNEEQHFEVQGARKRPEFEAAKKNNKPVHTSTEKNPEESAINVAKKTEQSEISSSGLIEKATRDTPNTQANVNNLAVQNEINMIPEDDGSLAKMFILPIDQRSDLDEILNRNIAV